jgi:hypothetical protein
MYTVKSGCLFKIVGHLYFVTGKGFSVIKAEVLREILPTVDLSS